MQSFTDIFFFFLLTNLQMLEVLLSFCEFLESGMRNREPIAFPVGELHELLQTRN